jgi:hypothetical protein
VIRHAGLGIRGSEARHKFGGIGIARYDSPPSRLARTQCLFAKYERNTVLLPHASVARDAILIQDRLDIPAELYSIVRCPME